MISFSRDDIGLSNRTLLHDEIQHTHVEAHHSAGGRPLSVEDAMRDIRSFYHYHVVLKGWRDIYYSLLVDIDGNVYEGRGIGNQSVGTALTLCFLGNYEHDQPTMAQILVLQEYADRYGGLDRLTHHRHRAAGTKYASLCPGINLIHQIQLMKSANSTRTDTNPGATDMTPEQMTELKAHIDQHFNGAIPPGVMEDNSLHHIERNRNHHEILEDKLLKEMKGILQSLDVPKSAVGANADEVAVAVVEKLRARLAS